VAAQGIVLGYLRPADALAIAPELDAGTQIIARLVAVKAEGEERAAVELNLEETGGQLGGSDGDLASAKRTG
jgi:hypothetical protein